MNEDALARFRRDHMGVVFQSFHLIPTMTALENVATAAGTRRRPRRLRHAPRRSSHAVGLGARLDHYPAPAVGRRAAARGAGPRRGRPGPRSCSPTSRPAISTARTGEAIIDLLFGLRDRHGATLVLVTHAPELAARCDRVIRLHDGALERYRRGGASEPAASPPASRCANCAAACRVSHLPRLPRARGRGDRRRRLGARRHRGGPRRARRACHPRRRRPDRVHLSLRRHRPSAPGWTRHAREVSEIVDFRSMATWSRDRARGRTGADAGQGGRRRLSALRHGRTRRRRRPLAAALAPRDGLPGAGDARAC